MIAEIEPLSQCVSCRVTSDTLGHIKEEATKSNLSLSHVLETKIKKSFELLFGEISDNTTK